MPSFFAPALLLAFPLPPASPPHAALEKTATHIPPPLLPRIRRCPLFGGVMARRSGSGRNKEGQQRRRRRRDGKTRGKTSRMGNLLPTPVSTPNVFVSLLVFRSCCGRCFLFPSFCLGRTGRATSQRWEFKSTRIYRRKKSPCALTTTTVATTISPFYFLRHTETNKYLFSPRDKRGPESEREERRGKSSESGNSTATTTPPPTATREATNLVFFFSFFSPKTTLNLLARACP